MSPGGVALLLAELARREHRHAEMRPKTSPQKDKSTALRGTPTPPRPANGHPKGDLARGNLTLRLGVRRPQSNAARHPAGFLV